MVASRRRSRFKKEEKDSIVAEYKVCLSIYIPWIL
jgi:hypothetical protein